MLEHLYSGHLFFSALSVLVVVVSLDLTGAFARSTALQSVARIVTLLSIAIAAFSATPVPVWLGVPGGAFAAAFLFANRETRARPRSVAGLVTIVIAIAAIAWETRYHLGGAELQRPVRIVVLGDSLSAGGFGEERVWPDLLGGAVGAVVVNLSRPGDTTAAAIEGQLQDVPPAAEGDLVILELGGNDMLEGAAAAAFEEAVDVLSGNLASGGRHVAMFELPLLPGRWAYGAAQRRVAARHGIELIPKRVLAGVLLDPSTTNDGLHLTQKGHDELSMAVEKWAGWR